MKVRSGFWIPCVSRIVGIRGFSLVEVVLAMGIMAFGLVAIFALLPTGLTSVQDGKMEEAASDILTLAAVDLRATSATNGISPVFAVNARAASPTATTNFLNIAGGKVATPEQAKFRLVASPQASTSPELIVWNLAVQWPPQATDPSNRVETVIFLRR